MTADELSFSKRGLEDMGFEAPRMEIPAEVAAQQCGCGCSACYGYCSYDCHSECLGSDEHAYYYTNDRLSNYDGEHSDQYFRGW